jgi:hypothetical protein
MRIDARSEIESEMLDRYGPLIGGADLIRALGYRSNSAFRRADRMRILGVRVFSIPDRKGKYALTRDIAEWLDKLAADANAD